LPWPRARDAARQRERDGKRWVEREREGECEKSSRAKDFYALLSHFRVYIVNWLTSNDEGATKRSGAWHLEEKGREGVGGA